MTVVKLHGDECMHGCRHARSCCGVMQSLLLLLLLLLLL
jgi:hypothetical protein